MQNIEQILESGLNEDLIRGIFSNPRDKEYLSLIHIYDGKNFLKIKL